MSLFSPVAAAAPAWSAHRWEFSSRVAPVTTSTSSSRRSLLSVVSAVAVSWAQAEPAASAAHRAKAREERRFMAGLLGSCAPNIYPTGVHGMCLRTGAPYGAEGLVLWEGRQPRRLQATRRKRRR